MDGDRKKKQEQRQENGVCGRDGRESGNENGNENGNINGKVNGNANVSTAALSGVLALAAVFTLPQMLNLRGSALAVSNSWFSVLTYGMFWFLCYRSVLGIQQQCGRMTESEKTGREAGHGMAAAGILACLFSLCLAFGVQLERKESVDFRSGILWVSVLIWTVVLMLWIYHGWMLLARRGDRSAVGTAESVPKKKTEEGLPKESVLRESVPEKDCWKDKCGKWRGYLYTRMEKWDRVSGSKRAAVTVCLFLLCWLPVFLAVYPGFFVYDAQDELVQVQTRQFTTHHPLPHVLLLGGIIQAVYKITGSYNTGIATYTVLQMAGMAGVFTYMLSYMRKSGVSRRLRVIAALYFGLFPVNVMFVLCSAKDGIFSAALLLMLTGLAELAKEGERFFTEKGKVLLFAVSALVMMCFRHNGMYAFLVLMPVILRCYGKGYRRKTGLLLFVVFAAYVLVSSGLVKVLGAQDSEHQEMLTVPIQQLARVWKYEGDSLTEEQKEMLYEILPEEALPYYTAKVSDGVKVWFDNEAFGVNPAKYIRLWMEVGIRHPFTYLNAWFMTSYGFWYPDTVIDVYRGNSVFTFTYGDSSFFGYEVELPGERKSRIPWLEECYRKMSLEIAQQKIPAVSMLFSPGFLFWVFTFAGGYAYYRKKYELLLPFVMLGLLWLTVVLGPTYLPRYVLVLWFALPWAVAVLVNEV